MQIKADTPEQYIDQLPEDRKEVIEKLRKVILDNLPKGFAETMSNGMISYVIPHSLYPSGYHCNPKKPLPFISVASQKNHIAVYHMGIYSDKKLMDWFTSEHQKRCKAKLDIGKSCIRFKHLDEKRYELVGELSSKMSTDEWIKIYESQIKR